MDILSVIAIGIGLSMDAFAVSITSGFVTKNLRFYQALRMALFFGGFQFLMPVIGWLAGLTVRTYIVSFDHWLAFGLLAFVGGKMIFESFHDEGEKSGKKSPMELPTLFLLAVATSIDALAVGLSLSFIKVSIILPSVLIGVITFSISLAGVFIGKKFGHLFEKKMELVGGLVLIGIGFKILLEHLLKTS